MKSKWIAASGLSLALITAAVEARAEIGHGADARGDSRDRVHAAGGQLGITSIDWHVALNFHGFYEYETRNRPQGYSLGLSAVKKF